MEDDIIKLLFDFDDGSEKLNLNGKMINGLLELNKFELLKQLDCKKNNINEISNFNEKLVYLDCFLLFYKNKKILLCS